MRWAQHGLAQPAHHSPGPPLVPPHGLAAWTAGHFLCIPVLGVVRAGAQQPWAGRKWPRGGNKVQPSGCRCSSPPHPVPAPGGVQARVTCFCLRPDSQVPEATDPMAGSSSEPTKTWLAPSLRNENRLLRSWPGPAAPFCLGPPQAST